MMWTSCNPTCLGIDSRNQCRAGSTVYHTSPPDPNRIHSSASTRCSRDPPTKLSILEARFTLSDVYGPENRPACPLHGESQLLRPEALPPPQPPRERADTPNHPRRRSRMPLPYAKPVWDTWASRSSPSRACGGGPHGFESEWPAFISSRCGWVEPGKGWTRAPSTGRPRSRLTRRCFRRCSRSYPRRQPENPHQVAHEIRDIPHRDAPQPSNDCACLCCGNNGLGNVDIGEMPHEEGKHHRRGDPPAYPEDGDGRSGRRWAAAYLTGEDGRRLHEGSHSTPPRWTDQADVPQGDVSRERVWAGAWGRPGVRRERTQQMKDELNYARGRTWDLIESNQELAKKVVALRKQVEARDNEPEDRSCWSRVAAIRSQLGRGNGKAGVDEPLIQTHPSSRANSRRQGLGSQCSSVMGRGHPSSYAEIEPQRGTYQYAPLLERIARANVSQSRKRTEADAHTQTDEHCGPYKLRAAGEPSLPNSVERNAGCIRQETTQCGTLSPEQRTCDDVEREIARYQPSLLSQPEEHTAVAPQPSSPEKRAVCESFPHEGTGTDEKEPRKNGAVARGRVSRQCRKSPLQTASSRKMRSCSPRKHSAVASQATSAIPDITAMYRMQRPGVTVAGTEARPELGPENSRGYSRESQVGCNQLCVDDSDRFGTSPTFDDRVVKAAVLVDTVPDVQSLRSEVRVGIRQTVHKTTEEWRTMEKDRHGPAKNTEKQQDQQSTHCTGNNVELAGKFPEQGTANPSEQRVAVAEVLESKSHRDDSEANLADRARTDAAMGGSAARSHDSVEALRLELQRTKCALAAFEAASSLVAFLSRRRSPSERMQIGLGGVGVAFTRWRRFAFEGVAELSTETRRVPGRSLRTSETLKPHGGVEYVKSGPTAYIDKSLGQQAPPLQVERSRVYNVPTANPTEIDGSQEKRDSSPTRSTDSSSHASLDRTGASSPLTTASRVEAIEAIRRAVREQQSQLCLIPDASGWLVNTAMRGEYSRVESELKDDRPSPTPASRCQTLDLAQIRREPRGVAEIVGSQNVFVEDGGEREATRAHSILTKEQALHEDEHALMPFHAVGFNAWKGESVQASDSQGQGKMDRASRPQQRSVVTIAQNTTQGNSVPPTGGYLRGDRAPSEGLPGPNPQSAANEEVLKAIRSDGCDSASQYEAATVGEETSANRVSHEYVAPRMHGRKQGTVPPESATELRPSEFEVDGYRKKCAVLAGTTKIVLSLAALEYRKVSARFYRWKRLRKRACAANPIVSLEGTKGVQERNDRRTAARRRHALGV